MRTDTQPIGFKIGELDGQDTERARRLAGVMSDVAGAKVTTNLFGERWSKLTVNCMANPIAGLSGLGSAEVRSMLGPARIAIQLGAEAISVGRRRGFEVETAYHFLQWEDIIRRDFARPTWWKILRALAVLAKSIVEGSLWRVGKASWRFGLFVAYPYAVLLAHGVVAALLGFIAASIAGVWIAGHAIPWLLGLSAAATSAVLLIHWTEARTYMLYLFDDIVSHCQYAHRQRPDWEARFDVFAEDLIAAQPTPPRRGQQREQRKAKTLTRGAPRAATGECQSAEGFQSVRRRRCHGTLSQD